MDAIVQFTRNFLCCIKDLDLFRDSIPSLYDASKTSLILGELSEPMDKTTPLELIISITQFYVCISCTKSGIPLVTNSVGKLRRILRIVETRMTQKPEKDWTHADRIVNESLLKEAKFALRSVFVGMCVWPIGIAFWWLFLNSFHVTEVDWYGGLPALIHALTVMECCLLPLLFFMIKDGFECLQKSKNSKDLLEKIQKGTLEPGSISIYSYETMTGWTPFWDGGVSIFSSTGQDEDKQTEKEVEKVKGTFSTLFLSEGDKKKNEKEKKLRKQALEDAEEKLETAVTVSRFEGYREIFYFVVNCIAFYGYLMGIIAFYYDDEESQPSHVRSLKFGYNNSDADWTGNFVGDMMWTVEPIVILTSPFLLAMAKPQKKNKVKSD